MRDDLSAEERNALHLYRLSLIDKQLKLTPDEELKLAAPYGRESLAIDPKVTHPWSLAESDTSSVYKIDYAKRKIIIHSNSTLPNKRLAFLKRQTYPSAEATLKQPQLGRAHKDWQAGIFEKNYKEERRVLGALSKTSALPEIDLLKRIDTTTMVAGGFRSLYEKLKSSECNRALWSFRLSCIAQAYRDRDGLTPDPFGTQDPKMWIHYLQFVCLFPDKSPALPEMNADSSAMKSWLSDLKSAYLAHKSSASDLPPSIAKTFPAEANRSPPPPLPSPSTPISIPLSLVEEEMQAGTLKALHSAHFVIEAKSSTSETDLTFLSKPFPLKQGERRYALAIAEEFEAFDSDYRAGVKKNHATHSHKLTGNLDTLKEQLSTQLQSQQSKGKETKTKILKIARKKASNLQVAMRERILREARVTQDLTIDELIILFLKGKEELFANANPHLNKQEITTLYTDIGQYLIDAILIGQIKRSISLIDRLPGSDQEQSDELTARLGEILHHSTTYSFATHPEYLVFEYYSGLQLRPKQIDLLTQMLKKSEGGNYQDQVVQLIMGGGKTSVLAVLLGLKAAKPGRLSLFVTTRIPI